MRNRSRLVLALLAALTFGSLLTTGGYAWYLRSDSYRESCAAALSASLELPSEIGQVVPRSRRSYEVRDVRVWLPQRRGEAAFVRRALLVNQPTPDDPNAYTLELTGGHCEISTRTWLREDYRFVLESGLRPGFDPDGPRRVVFSGMDLAFQRDEFQAALSDALGVVSFEDLHLGHAAISCNEFNGHRATQPVTLQAEFSPQASGIQLDRVEIVVPKLPLAIVGLEDLAGLGLQTGAFSGRMIYRERDVGRELTVSGQIYDLRLAEISAAFFPRPWRGTAPELELEELTLQNGQPQRVSFRGVLKGVVLGDLLTPWNLGDVGGELVLRVHVAELSPAGIDRFIAAGRCENVALEELSAALGWGRMTGRARLVIDDLTIIKNHVTSLDAELVVETPEGQANWIERDLLSEVLARVLGFTLPAFLPERFEYSALGFRLEVRDEMLYVFGTHGPHGKTILTMRFGDQELGIVREPEDPIDLRAAFDELRRQGAEYVRFRLDTLTPREAWEALQNLPVPRPPAGPPPPPE